MKTVLFDMKNNCGWGDRSWVTANIAWYSKNNYKVYVHTGGWGQPNRSDYNPTNPKSAGFRPEKPKGARLYNPNTEPIDYYMNLLVPTLGIEFRDEQSNVQTTGWKNDIVYDLIVNAKTPHMFQNKEKVSKIKHKISKNLKNKSYYDMEKILRKKKNIILCSVWDEKNTYELWANRKKGLFINSEGYDNVTYKTEGMWEDIINVTKKIDKFCVENNDCRIVLFSKKAQNWPDILKSNYLDLRNFEDYNLSLAQVLHLLTNNATGMLSYSTSPQTWFALEERIKSIVWHPTYSYQDTILTAMVNNLSYFLRNPKDISEEKIKKIFS